MAGETGLAVTDGRQPPCRPLSANLGRRDAPAAMRGRQPRLLATFRGTWPAKRFGGHEWPPPPICRPLSANPGRRDAPAAMRGRQPRLSATFREAWPAKRFCGHGWPPTPLVGHFRRTLAGETHQRPCVAANPLAGHFFEEHGRRNDLAVTNGHRPHLPATFSEPWPARRTSGHARGRQPRLSATFREAWPAKRFGSRGWPATPWPATFSETWPARRFGDHAWPATRPRGDEETRRSGSCRDRRGRGGRDPQATMLLGSGETDLTLQWRQRLARGW